MVAELGSSRTMFGTSATASSTASLSELATAVSATQGRVDSLTAKLDAYAQCVQQQFEAPISEADVVRAGFNDSTNRLDRCKARLWRSAGNCPARRCNSPRSTPAKSSAQMPRAGIMPPGKPGSGMAAFGEGPHPSPRPPRHRLRPHILYPLRTIPCRRKRASCDDSSNQK